MQHKYEGKVVLWTDRELTDDEQRLFGDAMDGAENLIAGSLMDSGFDVEFQIELRGPMKVVAAG